MRLSGVAFELRKRHSHPENATQTPRLANNTTAAPMTPRRRHGHEMALQTTCHCSPVGRWDPLPPRLPIQRSAHSWAVADRVDPSTGRHFRWTETLASLQKMLGKDRPASVWRVCRRRRQCAQGCLQLITAPSSAPPTTRRPPLRARWIPPLIWGRMGRRSGSLLIGSERCYPLQTSSQWSPQWWGRGSLPNCTPSS